MSNPPRVKGTRAETAAANWLTNELGIVVTRGPLRGNQDRGDLFGIPDTVIEVKNCKTPNLTAWGKELAAECRNSDKRAGVVLWSPPGVGMGNVDRWIALEWFELRYVSAPVQSIPHIGPMNKLHRFVTQAAEWGATVMDAKGGCPQLAPTYQRHPAVIARLAEAWLYDVREHIAATAT